MTSPRADMRHADVVIIGGSVVGSSAAWHLRSSGFGGRIVIVERDPSYAYASAFRAIRGIGISAANGRVGGVSLAGTGFIATPFVVNAAGPWAGHVARLAGLDVPVEPMRQVLFRASLPCRWPHRFPMVIDPGGVHWRHDDPVEPGQPDRIIVAFTKWDEPVGENFEPAMERWSAEFLPALVRRLPALHDLRDVEGWPGLYEMTPDHNPLNHDRGWRPSRLARRACFGSSRAREASAAALGGTPRPYRPELPVRGPPPERRSREA